MRTTLLLALSVATLLVSVPEALAAPPAGNGKQDVETCLVRPASPLDADAKGSLRIRSKTKKQISEDRLDLKIRKVDTSAAHDLYMEDAIGSGIFAVVGSTTAADGGLELRIDTQQGDPLPFDAATVGDLSGRRVEVRSGVDVVLGGIVPAFGASKKPAKEKLELDPAIGAPPSKVTGRLRLRSKADKGQHRFALKIRKGPFGSTDLHVWCETGVGTDVYQDVGLVDRKGSSLNGRYRRDCKQGDPLPAGASDLAGLEGRRLQIRDDGDQVLLEGTLPSMD